MSSRELPCPLMMTPKVETCGKRSKGSCMRGPGVAMKKIFGAPSYGAGYYLFAVRVTRGIHTSPSQ